MAPDHPSTGVTMLVSTPANAPTAPAFTARNATSTAPTPSPRYFQWAVLSVMLLEVVVGPPEPADVPAVMQM
jgi:hypothetical protein